MAELKTKKTAASVEAFLAGVKDEQQREDARKVLALMEKVTRSEPRMWGAGVVGFGDYHYVYESGREGDWFEAGFSPRKDSLTLYLTRGLGESADLLRKLGTHRTGVGCLCIRRLADVDVRVLEQVIRRSVDTLRKWAKAPKAEAAEKPRAPKKPAKGAATTKARKPRK